MSEESLIVSEEPSAPIDAVEPVESVEGEHPEWFKADKYKSIEDQAKAYTDLEKKFGGFTGAPEEYEFSLNEGLEFEVAEDDPLLNDFKGMAKEMGMSNEAFNRVANMYIEQLAASEIAQKELASEHVETQMKALGDKAQERVQNVAQWAKAQLGSEELFNKFAAGLTDAGMVEVFETLINKTGNAAQATSHQVPAAPAMTEDEIKEMQFAVDEYGNRKMQNPEYAAKVRKAWEQLRGTKSTPQIVGM